MKDRTISVDLTVTGRDIDAICDAAFYGGISYWCGDLAVVKKPTEEGATVLSEYISRGGELSITDDEGETHVLTIDNILEGYKKYGATAPYGYDVDQYDAGSADSIIQYAVYGKLVYG